MSRDHDADAARFVETLRPAGPLPPPLPNANDVVAARNAEFPWITDMVGARTRALRTKYGEGYGVGFGLGTSRVDRAAERAVGYLAITTGDYTKPVQIDVLLDPGKLSFAGRSFAPDEIDQASEHLDDTLRPFFQ